MFRFILHRLAFSFKTTLLFLMVFGGIYFCGYYLYSELPSLIHTHYGITIDPSLILDHLSFTPFFIILSIIFFLLGINALDNLALKARINYEIQDSLEDRKLDANFSHFFSSRNSHLLIKNLVSVFSLYKSLENMKTARIVLEVATIKQMMSSISEGIILVNKELVVTHINHMSEERLGLISGESVGQAISRKISHEKLLESLEKAFEFDQKTLDIELKDYSARASLFPLKDKFGDIIRVLVVIKDATTSSQVKTSLESSDTTATSDSASSLEDAS